MVDEVGVPDRLVQLVREAQGQDVLDRLLAEVVVDAEHRVGREHRRDDVVQLAGGLQVGAGFSITTAPLVVVLLGEPDRFSCATTAGTTGGIDR